MILHKSTKNHDHMLYYFLNMVHDSRNFIFHFELFFALLPPNIQKKENFKKMQKNKQTNKQPPPTTKIWRYDFTQEYQKS